MALAYPGMFRHVRRVAASPLLGAVELSVVLVIMAYVDTAQWYPYSLVSLEPHPYWVPVILAAVCYGRPVGYFVAACAAALDATLGWSDLASHADLYAFLAANLRDAILWVAAVAVLGRVHERNAERQSETEGALEERAEEARVLAERCRDLMQEAAAREKMIAASDASAAGSVLEIFEKMIRVPGWSNLDGYKQALNMLIGAIGVAVYVPSETGWVRLPGSDASTAKAVPDAICESIASSEGVLSCLRPTEALLLDGHAAMAACVRGRDNQAIGVVFIEEVDPECMTNAGEAAISLGSFILGSRYLEDAAPALESRHAKRPKLRLRVVHGEAVGG